MTDVGAGEGGLTFDRQQFRLYTAIGQPAVSGLSEAAPQPLSLPVIPSQEAQPGPGAPPRPVPGPDPRPKG